MGRDFANGAFVARHGSWNRNPPSGYDVVFISFDELGNPAGKPRAVLTVFLESKDKARGRPTWLAWDRQGALLVSDDTAGIIWRVLDPQAAPATRPAALKSTPLPPRRELKGEATGAFKQDYIRTN